MVTKFWASQSPPLPSLTITRHLQTLRRSRSLSSKEIQKKKIQKKMMLNQLTQRMKRSTCATRTTLTLFVQSPGCEDNHLIVTLGQTP